MMMIRGAEFIDARYRFDENPKMFGYFNRIFLKMRKYMKKPKTKKKYHKNSDTRFQI